MLGIGQQIDTGTIDSEGEGSNSGTRSIHLGYNKRQRTPGMCHTDRRRSTFVSKK